MTDDATVNVNGPWGKFRAALTSKAAGTSLIVATYFLGVVLIAVVPYAIYQGYDIEASLTELSLKFFAPDTQRSRIADRKRQKETEKPQVAQIDSTAKNSSKQGETNHTQNSAPLRQKSPKAAKPIAVTQYGYYWERVPVVGDIPDGASAFDEDEGDYALVKRACIPEVDFPQQCNMPQKDRINHPLVRDRLN